jgi:hypothetical protein
MSSLYPYQITEILPMRSLPLFPLPAQLLLRIVLGLAAVDSAVVGLWALLRPEDVFRWVQLPEVSGGVPGDRLSLWSLLGVIALVYSLFLGILIWQPARTGPLALAPLLGRLIGCGFWLFVLGSDRVELADGPCLLLAAHDAFWALMMAGFLMVWWRAWRARHMP